MLRMMQMGCSCDPEELKQNEPRPMVLYSNGSIVAHMTDLYKMEWQIAPEYRTFYIDPALCVLAHSLVMLSLN
ncbi:MAG: hypothetical protein U9R60_00710 [Bacteroidota bacterium]|nr:hypothetical protein [Bacteroidota bacterium]